MEVNTAQIQHCLHVLVSARAHCQHQRRLLRAVEVMHRILEAGSHALILEIQLMEEVIEHSPVYLVVLFYELEAGAECLHTNVEVELVVVL